MHMRSACFAAAVLALVPGTFAQDADGKSSNQSNPNQATTANPPGTSVPILGSGGGNPQATNANLTLIRNWDRAAGVQYADIWGWTSPDYREFAFVAETAGIWFVETTDPNNIRQVGWWSAPSTPYWRDFANLDQYVYAVSEHHRGIRIFDMSNPDAPQDLGYVATSQIQNCHNITSDPTTGYLYLSGTNQGLAIFDATNRTNPVLVNTWYPSRTYTHDCCLLRGRAYLSNGYSYAARIMDATNPANLVEIGRCNTPGGYDHNVWVSDDDQVLCVTDEIERGGPNAALTVWDISNPRAPVQTDDYSLGSIIHNVFVLGRTAYMSHYTDGVHVVDITDPHNISSVGNYDTSTIASGYHGAWGVHPFTDNGQIYVSDIENGLYVFEMQCGHMNRYGMPTTGTGGATPRAIFADATPRVGASGLKLDIEGLAPNGQAFLFLGFAPGSLSVLGVEIHIDPAQAFSVDLTADANGKVTVPLPIPNDPNAANQRVYMQILAQDAGAPQGWSASRGMWMGICQ